LAIAGVTYNRNAVSNNDIVVSGVERTRTGSPGLVTNQNVAAPCGQKIASKVTERSVCPSGCILQRLRTNSSV
jgi:hypothetical protein